MFQGITMQCGEPSCHATNPLPKNAHRLESRFCLEQFSGLARKLGPKNFTIWVQSIYGHDIPLARYRWLHDALRKGTFPNPPIVFQGAAGYVRRIESIEVDECRAEAAVSEQRANWTLLGILAEEFGHHVDWQLRKSYPRSVKRDAKRDEGAFFAAFLPLLSFEEQPQAHYATYYCSAPVMLFINYEQIYAAVRQHVASADIEQDDQDARAEYWKAGGGDNQTLFSHESMEREALTFAGFSYDETRQVYFGNWLRDYSQLCDPKLMRSADASWLDGSMLAGLSRKELTGLVGVLARLKFWNGKGKSSPESRTFAVDTTRLGVYRPEEHIDNPRGIEATTDDPDFRHACSMGDFDLEIDESYWMKNYIRTTMVINTYKPNTKLIEKTKPYINSLDFIKKSLGDAIALGRNSDGLRHLGQALHTLEDFYAHSNFIELALRSLGYPVQVWTGPYASGFYPVTTGTFGGLDTAFSILDEISEKLKAAVNSQNDEIVLVVLTILIEHMKLGWLKDARALNKIWRSMKNLDDFTEKMARKLFWAAAKQLVSWWDEISARLVEKAQQEIKAKQTNDWDGTSTDPTHTLLAKDDFQHPLHTIAARCAILAIKDIAFQMDAIWKLPAGVRNRESLFTSVAGYLVHPSGPGTRSSGVEAQLKLIATWAKNPGNQHTLEKVADRNYMLEQMREHEEKHRNLARMSRKRLGDPDEMKRRFDAIEAWEDA